MNRNDGDSDYAFSSGGITGESIFTICHKVYLTWHLWCAHRWLLQWLWTIWLQSGLHRWPGESGGDLKYDLKYGHRNVCSSGRLCCGLQSRLWRWWGWPQRTPSATWSTGRQFRPGLLQPGPLWLPTVSGLLLKMSPPWEYLFLFSFCSSDYFVTNVILFFVHDFKYIRASLPYFKDTHSNILLAYYQVRDIGQVNLKPHFGFPLWNRCLEQESCLSVFGEECEQILVLKRNRSVLEKRFNFIAAKSRLYIGTVIFEENDIDISIYREAHKKFQRILFEQLTPTQKIHNNLHTPSLEGT